MKRLENGQSMVRSNSMIMIDIYITQIFENQKRACGISIRTRNAKAHDLRRCSVSNALRGGGKYRRRGYFAITNELVQ